VDSDGVPARRFVNSRSRVQIPPPAPTQSLNSRALSKATLLSEGWPFCHFDSQRGESRGHSTTTEGTRTRRHRRVWKPAHRGGQVTQADPLPSKQRSWVEIHWSDHSFVDHWPHATPFAEAPSGLAGLAPAAQRGRRHLSVLGRFLETLGRSGRYGRRCGAALACGRRVGIPFVPSTALCGSEWRA